MMMWIYTYMYKHLGVLCGQKGKWSMLLVVMDKRISIYLPHEVEWSCVFHVQCLSVVGKHCFRHFHSVL